MFHALLQLALFPPLHSFTKHRTQTGSHSFIGLVERKCLSGSFTGNRVISSMHQKPEHGLTVELHLHVLNVKPVHFNRLWPAKVFCCIKFLKDLFKNSSKASHVHFSITNTRNKGRKYTEKPKNPEEQMCLCVNSTWLRRGRPKWWRYNYWTNFQTETIKWRILAHVFGSKFGE